ncbi:MAG: VacJ family lipoprotein [Hyphomonadaceae bacterium]
MRGALSAMTFAACLATPAVAQAQTQVPDPWEGFNRDMFAVHEAVDQAVLEPVARGYRAITPEPVREGVRNFLRNLRAPVILANDVLQGEVDRAGTTAARFAVNTTIGIGGVFDPASDMGLERHDEDFGQTLAVWGVESGPYLFVPLLGPTTVRDGVGRIADNAFDPLTYAQGEDADTVRIARGLLTAVSVRESLLETVDDLRANSLDPYVSLRSSYSLLRESAIQNGRVSTDDLPDFDDIPESSEPAVEDNAQHSGSIPPTDEELGLADVTAAPTSEPLQEN